MKVAALQTRTQASDMTHASVLCYASFMASGAGYSFAPMHAVSSHLQDKLSRQAACKNLSVAFPPQTCGTRGYSSAVAESIIFADVLNHTNEISQPFCYATRQR